MFPSAFTQFAEIVKDVNGNPIVPSKRYYIWPNYFEKGGEVRLGNTGNTSCHFGVFQEYDLSGGVGLPVKFIPRDTSTGDPISTGNKLDIVFENKPECAESSKWVVVKNYIYNHTKWLAVDGVEKYYGGLMIMDGWFEFWILDTGYGILFNTLNNVGSYIERNDEENGMRLVFRDFSTRQLPFRMVFVDVDAVRTGRSVV